jgi:hypothetical protein
MDYVLKSELTIVRILLPSQIVDLYVECKHLTDPKRS